MYYGQQNLDEILHKSFFSDKKNGFFVECGAYDGMKDSTCKFFEDNMEWSGLNIEPVPFLFDMLKNNRSKCINECVALSDNNEKNFFSHAIHPNLGKNFGNGSLAHTEFHLNELKAIGCSFSKFEVQCVRYDILHVKHNLPPIDLFVLDVEGHEISALDGILSINKPDLPKVFCIEHTLSDLNVITAKLSEFYSYHSQFQHNAFFTRK